MNFSRSVAFIGAGNLATRLGEAMQKKGFDPVQVFSRTPESAAALAKKLGCEYTCRCEEIRRDAGLYVFAIKDEVLPSLLPAVPPNKGLWIHTAGSVDMQIFAPYTNRYGVLYPLQTFSKNREVDFSAIPVFIEACNAAEHNLLSEIAGCLSGRVIPATTDDRKYIHLAAVFACNFTNYLYAAANGILAERNLPFDILLPLIDETAAKVHRLTPADAQTGPAVRYDETVMNRQLELLTDPSLKEIYARISRNIFSLSGEKTNNQSDEQNRL